MKIKTSIKYIIILNLWLPWVYSQAISPLPEPVTNNAVTLMEWEGNIWIGSFNGLKKGKQQQDISSSSFIWSSKNKQWMTIAPVPGKNGKLASQALSFNHAMWVIGGYEVAKDGSEVSTPEIYRIAPPWDRYQLETKMPTPVDDVVALGFQQKMLILVSGWSNHNNVDKVQIYDTENKQWQSPLTFPGTPVFGHSGVIIGNKILIVDGVRVIGEKNGHRQFATIRQAWLGEISNNTPITINWMKVNNHPGLARYRMAAIAIPEKQLMVFLGGSETPYNYNGIGYNGTPAEPEDLVLLFDLKNNCWLSKHSKSVSVMDLRGLVKIGNKIYTVGGMGKHQKVLDRVRAFDSDGLQSLKCLL